MSARIVTPGCSESSSAITVTPSCAALVSARCVRAAMSQLRSMNSGTPDPTYLSSPERQLRPGCELRTLAPSRVRSRFWPRGRAAADVGVRALGACGSMRPARARGWGRRKGIGCQGGRAEIGSGWLGGGRWTVQSTDPSGIGAPLRGPQPPPGAVEWQCVVQALRSSGGS